jgi:uncharacterized membrane protein
VNAPLAWAVRAVVVACCVLGFFASRTMHAKAEADQRGELREPSVVQTPRARLFGGVDNALIGLVFYPAVAIGVFFFSVPAVRIATLFAAAAATAVSLFLLYSLLFITKMKCTNCLIAHASNIAIMCGLAEIALTT